MSDYILLADSSCDIPQHVLSGWGIEECQLSFTFDGESKIYLNSDMEPSRFYRRVRSGAVARSSAINVETFCHSFERYLQAGYDVLYPAFSSALSGTCQFARIAAKELEAAFPGRRIRVIDTRCASAGYGLLLYRAAGRKKDGADLEETAAFVEKERGRICHWFTVDDLNYLKRGGRLSSTAAALGTFLHVKPVLHVNEEGGLVSVRKARGREAAILELARCYDRSVSDRSSPVFIGHGDCPEDAEALSALLQREYGTTGEIQTYDIGAVIGSHSGPGTLALFFRGNER